MLHLPKVDPLLFSNRKYGLLMPLPVFSKFWIAVLAVPLKETVAVLGLGLWSMLPGAWVVNRLPSGYLVKQLCIFQVERRQCFQQISTKKACDLHNPRSCSLPATVRFLVSECKRKAMYILHDVSFSAEYLRCLALSPFWPELNCINWGMESNLELYDAWSWFSCRIETVNILIYKL